MNPARLLACTLATLLATLTSKATAGWPPDVEAALAAADKNRGELEKVLNHYRDLGDEQMLSCAQFLIGNMPGHGHVVFALKDKARATIPFDALASKDFAAAQLAMDQLEKLHGPLEFGRGRTDEDVRTITSGQLIENIDLTFWAWRTLPWARAMNVYTLREYVLPYRGSEEPANSFRPAMIDRFKDLSATLKDSTSATEAGKAIQANIASYIAFSELYYLHPTDQGFNEMARTRLGRCEDITNMQLYALRANGIACASDYTPAWANRDNNHAWEVILNANGEGRAELANIAAKIYRKTYSTQPAALGSQLAEGEAAPRWLKGKHYADVTSQYMPVSDVTIELKVERPKGARFVYLCVFNGGEWVPIHWAALDADEPLVHFKAMGRNICYLPAYLVNDQIIPAAAPLILEQDGTTRLLDGTPPGGSGPGWSSSKPDTTSIEITTTVPSIPDADTRREKPSIKVEPGVTYELLVWDDALKTWNSHGTQTASDKPVTFDKVPRDRLLWMKTESGRNLERIFTIESGRQIFW